MTIALALVVIASMVLAACAQATPTAAPAATTAAPAATTAAPAATTAAPAKSDVEIFSWWVGPGEADGLAAMMKIFAAQYPQYNLVNAAVAGGAGSNAKAVLATRLQAGDPPDSWQAHAGQETLANYLTSKQIQPLDDLFTSTGFGKVLPATLLPLISQDGHPYSVPVDIHRSNVMWYNPKVLADAKVTIPDGGFTSWADFFKACDAVKAAGKVCLSMGNEGFTAMHLFENVVVGTIGAAKWNGLWTTPPTTDWAGADVKEAIANYAKALSYINSDASTLSDWQPASKMVADGDAAFNIMGDWAYGYFANAAPNGLALKPGTDFAWTPVPGTQKVFVFLSDSFVLPVGNKNPQGTMAWLTVAASKDGQEAFNPLKGSICARTDCDPSKFSQYSQDAMKDWTAADETVVGSLTHGVVAAPAWSTSIDTALKLFIASDLGTSAQATFQQGLAAACKSDGTCK
jgi:ABC-type sugar transport system, periplasmic component